MTVETPLMMKAMTVPLFTRPFAHEGREFRESLARLSH
jgi:hypothetical protein